MPAIKVIYGDRQRKKILLTCLDPGSGRIIKLMCFWLTGHLVLKMSTSPCVLVPCSFSHKENVALDIL